MNYSAIDADAINLLHRFEDVVQMFEDMVGVEFVNLVVSDGPRVNIEVMDDFSAAVFGAPIYADTIVVLVFAATEI